MAEFLVKTKGGISSQGKSRVYFCCHPDDFSRYFDKICEDVFLSQNTAIYYTADMTESLDETNIRVDLGRMNLFIVPVTLRLMREENRAMSVDIAYAKEHNIPILPIMMESGIDEIYSKPENFGERQYISPFITDITAISYEEKLKKHLSATLISDDMAKRVRAAFDAYVFLSYRKKDRHYANELMKMIHRIPGCRDIAIWYDEFLTPGESFTENIKRAMDQSKLFTLLVTPHILEDGNFVMTEEYPKARQAKMDILPAEMESTDRTELIVKFEGIPEPVSTEDDLFSNVFLETVKSIAIRENDSSPEHNFLIGLAYLDGIDVEVDTERALELITSSAEAELPEAMIMLCEMYRNGKKVTQNVGQVLKWSERIVDFYTKTLGGEDEKTLFWLTNLSAAYSEMGNYKLSEEIGKRVYEIVLKTKGEDDIKTHHAYMNLLSTRLFMCRTTEDYRDMASQYEAFMDRVNASLGEDNLIFTFLLPNLASCYDSLQEYEKNIEINLRAYDLQCRTIGEENISTLATMNNLAVGYSRIGDYEKAKEFLNQAYEISCKVHSEKSHISLMTLQNMAFIAGHEGNYALSLEMGERAYDLSCRILGEEHPSTIRILLNIAIAHGNLDDLEKECEIEEKVVELSYKVHGNAHQNVYDVLNTLSQTYSQLGREKEQVATYERMYDVHCAILGEEHPASIDLLSALIKEYNQLPDLESKLRLLEKQYAIFRKCYGKKKKQTVEVLEELAKTCAQLKDYKKAIDYYDRLYNIKRKSLGEEDIDTFKTLKVLANLYGKIGENEKKAELGKKLFSYYRSKYEHDCKFDHMWSACMYFSFLAESYYDLGYYDEAFPLYEELYELSLKYEGEDCWHVITAMDHMAYILTFRNEYERALELFERVLVARAKEYDDSDNVIIRTKKNIEYVKSKIK